MREKSLMTDFKISYRIIVDYWLQTKVFIMEALRMEEQKAKECLSLLNLIQHSRGNGKMDLLLAALLKIR
jgi:hypothetical protein